MSDEERASLVKNGFPPHELAPLSPEEQSAFCQAMAVRTGSEWEWPLELYPKTYDFSFTHFDRPVAFAGFLFSERIAEFTSAKFRGRADFRSTRFGPAYFDSATFAAASSFESATFSGYAGFHSATFAESVCFKSATFNEHVFFQKAQFGFPSFESAEFFREADFKSASFSSFASFASVKFKDRATFPSATFSEYASFERATFSQQTDFESAKFSRLSFASAKFDWLAIFTSAKFSGDAHFNSATFNSDVIFYSATFSGVADFASATFLFSVFFDFAKFENIASFNGATFFQYTSLINAKFGGRTIFAWATFRTHVPDFRGATMHEGTEWHSARWPWPPNGRDAAQPQIYSYERIKLEMKRLKKHEDELFFFRKELRARRGLARPGSGKWYLNFAYQASSNYGQSIALPMFWLFVLFATGCAVFYAMQGVAVDTDALSFAAILHAAALSFGNIFPFVPVIQEIVKANPVTSWSWPEKIIGVAQTLLGTPLLFLLGLALRNRFRMR